MTALTDFTKNEKHAKTHTPQDRAARPEQVVNNAGGFVFEVTAKTRLERFLILGSDSNTYYVNAKDQTKDAVGFLRGLIKTDERLVVDMAVDVSVNGRAYRNSPAIFAIALVMTEGKDKAYARAAVQKICRTSTHLFEFAQYVDDLGGWGRAKRKAVTEWYESKTPENLAYQAVKYRQRNGWTHKDLLRLSHAKPNAGVAEFVLGKPVLHSETPIIDGFLQMQRQVDVKGVLATLDQFKNLPWEAIPTQFLTNEKVWKKLFYNGQLNGQALIRNITRLARNGAFKDLQFAADYAAKLTDEAMIAKTRLHPINYLNAAVVYDEGQVQRQGRGYGYGYRTKDWTSESVIRDALNEGFHLAFKHVEPAGKRTMLAIDVSGSMGGLAMGLDLSCAQVSGALAMTIARTEPAHIIRGFTSSGGWGRGTEDLTDLGISAKTSLSDAMRKVQKNNFGGTDCAQPMVWALKEKIEIDHFVVITDNETWAGNIHPFQALDKYKNSMGIDARVSVLGVASTGFSIADSSRNDMMDFVGFDSNTPKVLADFGGHRI